MEGGKLEAEPAPESFPDQTNSLNLYRAPKAESGSRKRKRKRKRKINKAIKNSFRMKDRWKSLFSFFIYVVCTCNLYSLRHEGIDFTAPSLAADRSSTLHDTHTPTVTREADMCNYLPELLSSILRPVLIYTIDYCLEASTWLTSYNLKIPERSW